MGNAERRFKLAVHFLVKNGVHPTMTPINRQVARLGGTRVSRLNELNGRELKWLREDLKVSPIRACWRKDEMGPCKLRCCVPGGPDLEDTFIVDPLCAAELTVGDTTRVCSRRHSDARHNFEKEGEVA